MDFMRYLWILAFIIGCQGVQSNLRNNVDSTAYYQAKVKYYDSCYKAANRDYDRHAKSADSAMALRDRKTTLKYYVQENLDTLREYQYNDSLLFYMEKVKDVSKK